MRDRKWKSKPQSWRCSYLEKLSSEERKDLITQYEMMRDDEVLFTSTSAKVLASKHNVSVDSLNAYLRRWGVRLR